MPMRTCEGQGNGGHDQGMLRGSRQVTVRSDATARAHQGVAGLAWNRGDMCTRAGKGRHQTVWPRWALWGGEAQ